MSKQIEALKLALEAMEDMLSGDLTPYQASKTITSIKEALADQPAQPSKPLTDVAIWNTYKNLWMFHPAEEPRLAGDILKFARAIEAAHGIKEKRND